MSNVTYSYNHHQAGAPMINTRTQSTLHTAHDLCKNVSLELSNYLITTALHIQYLRGQISVGLYTHILHNIETLVGQKNEKIGRAGNATCQGSSSACHRFSSPELLVSLSYLFSFNIEIRLKIRRFYLLIELHFGRQLN